MEKIRTAIRYGIAFLSIVFVLQRSALPPADYYEQIRSHVRSIEFDFISWTLDALLLKGSQASLKPWLYLDPDTQKQVVKKNLVLVEEVDRTNAEIERIYTDPGLANAKRAAQAHLAQLRRIEDQQQKYAPLAESIIQQQVSDILAQEGLAPIGQPIPPVLFHSTPLPMALIVSPRNAIRQDANISLLPEINLDEIVKLEQDIEQSLNVSALVVPVGGIGIYPTMVMNTTNLPFMIEVVAHEWIHNFLSLRPLGINYYTNNELRTMNETTAALAGKEIGDTVLRKYYPEMAPPELEQTQPESAIESSPPPPPPEEEGFNFRREMHTTRVRVDELLAQNKIEEAEAYMEERRELFWDNGYQIRRLNQAYFAFHGAYADEPGGAAGQDPVGPAVRSLRAKSKSLAEFIQRISMYTSFEELQEAVK